MRGIFRKMKWKIKNFITICLMFVSSHAAIITLDCPSLDPLECYISSISNLTQVDEEIVVSNPPFTPFIDNTNRTLSFDPPPDTVFQFPRRLFDIFTNVAYFVAARISSPELGTDSFYNCQNLFAIEMGYCSIKHLAERFAGACSKVYGFAAIQCNIETIDENAFEGMSLTTLYLYENRLTCLPPKLFQHTLNINSIYLNDNQLTALHSKLFSNLRKLHYVSFMNNQIGYIPNFDFDTTSIEADGHFLLNFNPIAAIDPSFLNSFSVRRATITSPIVLYMGNPSYEIKNITCFDERTIDDGNSQFSLATIGMYQNFAVQNAFYENSTTCYSSYTDEMASDSLITCNPELFTTTSTSTLPPTTPSDIIIPSGQCATDKVCRFYLDWNNQYTCVIDRAEGTVTSITGTHYLTYTNADVKRVYFINSHLSLVPKILFQTFPNLKFLHTANSGMTVINDQTFNECGVLELWDASDNDISRVDETSLRNCTNLRIIDLTGNPIDFVSQGLYQLDPALERIHLTRLDDWTLA